MPQHIPAIETCANIPTQRRRASFRIGLEVGGAPLGTEGAVRVLHEWSRRLAAQSRRLQFELRRKMVADRRAVSLRMRTSP
jgi:hypothetical protein